MCANSHLTVLLSGLGIRDKVLLGLKVRFTLRRATKLNAPFDPTLVWICHMAIPIFGYGPEGGFRPSLCL